MNPEITLFPYGELQGAPVLAVTLDGIPTTDQLLQVALSNRYPGIRALWIREAPWGEVDLDTVILRFAADERTQTLPIIGVRPLGDEWSQLALYWIADVSRFLGEPCTQQQVEERIMSMAYHPVVREIVLRRPPLANLRYAILDEVYGFLNPDGVGTIYCPPGDEEYKRAALMQVVRAATPWVIRDDQGGN